MRKNFLLGNQEYPANALAEKRLMTDFGYSNVGKPTSLVKQQEQVQPTDVAFVEKVKWDGGPICYCCGNIHEGRVAGVPEGTKQGKVEDSGHGRLGAFRYQNGK